MRNSVGRLWSHVTGTTRVVIAAARPSWVEARQFLTNRAQSISSKLSLQELRAMTGDMRSEAWRFLRSSAPDFEHIARRRLRQLQGLFAGGVIGAGAGVLLGGGGIGIVALGGAIGLPLVAVTALVGAVAGQFAGSELDWLRHQWSAAADRKQTVAQLQHQLGAKRDACLREGERWSYIRNRDHLPYLYRAIEQAHRCVTIRSAFLSDYVVNERLCRALHAALNRNVDVCIEYGYEFPWETLERKSARNRAEENLRALCQQASSDCPGQLRIGKTPTHIKELAVDDRIVVIGSNNWLSNAGGRNREKSTELENPALARDVRVEALSGIEKFKRLCN